jgi:hypothetical protein
MNDEDDNKSAGRPFKMVTWLSALKEVLADEDILFLSDKDLVFLVNDKLPKKQRIADNTFEKWKAGQYAPNESVGKEFIQCIKLALIKQKQYLGERLRNDTTGQWTRYAWILERKFADWNLKHVSENINKNETETVINITAGNEAQRKLIDDLINSTDFIEIKPNQIEGNQNNEIEDELPF